MLETLVLKGVGHCFAERGVLLRSTVKYLLYTVFEF